MFQASLSYLFVEQKKDCRYKKKRIYASNKTKEINIGEFLIRNKKYPSRYLSFTLYNS